MKKNLFSVFIFFLIFSCNCEKKNTEKNAVNSDKSKTDQLNDIIQTTDADTKSPFYIIVLDTKNEKNQAIERVSELRKKYRNTGYLWIPEFESLNGKKMYAVFVGPFAEQDTCVKELIICQKENKNVYGVIAQHDKQKIEIHDALDIRIDNVRQKMILTFAEPKSLEDYYNQGGEDWGWFVDDVTNYFNKYYPDVIIKSAYDYLDNEEIKKLIKELKPDGFGYVLIKENKKMFLETDVSQTIITETCSFFDYKYIPDDNPENQGE